MIEIMHPTASVMQCEMEASPIHMKKSSKPCASCESAKAQKTAQFRMLREHRQASIERELLECGVKHRFGFGRGRWVRPAWRAKRFSVLPKAKAVSALRSATALQNLAQFRQRSVLRPILQLLPA
jgi:hypothetical protein